MVESIGNAARSLGLSWALALAAGCAGVAPAQRVDMRSEHLYFNGSTVTIQYRNQAERAGILQLLGAAGPEENI